MKHTVYVKVQLAVPGYGQTAADAVANAMQTAQAVIDRHGIPVDPAKGPRIVHHSIRADRD